MNYNNQMSNLDRIERANNISNKEALKDKIHEIHNYLRNNGAGYGMNALKVFNLIYGLKKLEEKNLIDKVNLKRPDCEFSYLFKLASENKDEEIAELIRVNVLDSINESKIKDLLFYEIPNTFKGSALSYLIKEINKITIIEKTCNVLLSGKIYEYFIGRDESAISELGAYFTDRHIVDYIYNKLDYNINEDGSIDSMIDMFGGSGGFTTGYANYLNDKYDNIDWKDNINKIYHFDMNEDVVKSAGLEIFCLTGELPDMKNNITYKNSFTSEYDNKKFMNIITNPPYGGDKTSSSNDKIKRNKIKDYINKELIELNKNKSENSEKIKLRILQLKEIDNKDKEEKKASEQHKVSLDTCSQRIRKFAKKYSLKGNDKEACSLILMMEMLDINGTAIGVLKEGVFFNSKYGKIRKCLVENFNVKEIISVPQNQFENTSTKTSIVIFNNTNEKTSNVLFSEIKVETFEEDKFEEINNKILLIESKGDICNIKEEYISEASKDEIINHKSHSLNGKDYNKKELKVSDNYELIKLGSICEFLPKSKRQASFGQKEGLYNFYTSSDKVQKCDIADYNEESLIIGDGGVANIQIDSNFSCSDHNHIIITRYNKYIYYLINGNMNLLISGFTGSVLKNLSKDYLVNLQIPIPKNKEKITEWVEKISNPYDKKLNAEKEFKELEEEIKNKIKHISENEECEEVKLGDIIDSKIKPIFTINTNEMNNNGEYPFYNKVGNPLGYHNNYNYNIESGILITKDGGSGPKIYGDNISLGAVKLIEGKFVATSANFVLKINKSFNLIYIYYLLKHQKNQIMDLANYSVKIGHIQYNKLIHMTIKIPKNKELITNLEPMFKKVEDLQNTIKESEIEYKQYIKELSEDAIIE